ncbi:hypothetical protein CROQUDRAFT_130003 [Cronartium quercuum f. sp. fusiforme G11]|uniref:Uncharacterized protein n=1 Tax=Cronartium quercuum f. sp. fusiforme G11 TaxID=708437 RepID=A0A9P6NQQ8_9BASI|nr:hypothetical protein CROQUDRAFT_130003 [Cronartium quercuum f. sp. fusiforme G11]
MIASNYMVGCIFKSAVSSLNLKRLWQEFREDIIWPFMFTSPPSRIFLAFVVLFQALRHHSQAKLCNREDYHGPHLQYSQPGLPGSLAKPRRRSFIPVPSPRPKLTRSRSASVINFLQSANPHTIKTDALRSKEQDAFEGPGHPDLFAVEDLPEIGDDDGLEKPSTPDFEPAVRTFKIVEPLTPPPKPKPKVGVVRRGRNFLLKLLMKMVEGCIGLVSWLKKVMRWGKDSKTHPMPHPEFDPSGLKVFNGAPNSDATVPSTPLEGMKALAWELILDPSKQDSVMGDIYGLGGESKTWPWTFTGTAFMGTKLIKTMISSELPKLGIADTHGLEEKFPEGIDEFLASFTKPEEKEVIENFTKSLNSGLNFLPADHKKRVPFVAQQYREERMERAREALGKPSEAVKELGGKA